MKTNFILVIILTVQNCTILNRNLLKPNVLPRFRNLKQHILKVTWVNLSCHLRQAGSLSWYQSIDFQTSYFHLLSHIASYEGPPYIRVYYLMQSYTLLLLSLFTLSTPKTPACTKLSPFPMPLVSFAAWLIKLSPRYIGNRQEDKYTQVRKSNIGQ